MSENIGLIVDVEARITKLERGLAKANATQRKAARVMERTAEDNARRIGSAYNGIGAKVQSAFAKMPDFAKALAPLAGGFLGGMAVGGIGEIVTGFGRAAKSIAEIGDEAKRAGLEVETFQEWKFVADQNRVSIDALVDGFKELSLRSDEFISTGVGPAAEAFGRLGLSADALKTKLKDPGKLMLDIMGRMEGMDKAAQIRIADEVFGGTGGEQFVQLLGKGQGALEATIQKAHDTGAVLDREMIDKAAEIDRRFQELSASVEGFGKRAVVAIADAAVELVDFREAIDAIFENEDTGRQIIGDEVYDALEKNVAAAEENRAELQQLQTAYADLSSQTQTTVPALLDAAATLDMLGQADAAATLRGAADEMQGLAGQFEAGTITGEEFATKLGDVQREADAAFAALSDVDSASFGTVIGELGRLGGVIATVTSQASALVSELAKAARVDTSSKQLDAMRQRQAAEKASMDSLNAMNAANEKFVASEERRNAATREQLDLERATADVRKRAADAGAVLTDQRAQELAQAQLDGDAARAAADQAARAGASGGGAGGGAGGKSSAEKASEFQREAQAIREKTSALVTESSVLLEIAASDRSYADAAAFAEAKVRLLTAAQAEGRAITPELIAQVDALAESYSKAGVEAERAGEAMGKSGKSAQDADRDVERGAGAITDLFMSATEGSESFANSLKSLAKQLMSGVIQKLIMSFASSGMPGAGLVGGLGSALGGFASGGFTGAGGKFEPAGLVHRGEFVMSSEAVRAIGVSNLERLHSAARNGLPGFSSGGLVSDTRKASRASGTPSRVSAGTTQNISISPVIQMNATGGTPEANADLAKQTARETERAMRSLVKDELIRQFRTGNMLAGR